MSEPIIRHIRYVNADKTQLALVATNTGSTVSFYRCDDELLCDLKKEDWLFAIDEDELQNFLNALLSSIEDSASLNRLPVSVRESNVAKRADVLEKGTNN